MRRSAPFCELDEVLTFRSAGRGQTASVRRSFAVGTWLLATTVASGLAWTAVDQVAARVTDRMLAGGPPAERVGVRPASGDTPATVAPAAQNGTALPEAPTSLPGNRSSEPPAVAPTPGTGQATVFVAGGSVTASCGAGSPRLVSAVPVNGYTTSVTSGIQLVVNFTSNTHRSIVEAECNGARVQFSTGEESAG